MQKSRKAWVKLADEALQNQKIKSSKTCHFFLNSHFLDFVPMCVVQFIKFRS